MSFISKLAHGIVAKPLIYDTVQRLAGLEISQARLRPYFAEIEAQSVLDIGGGTGIYLPVFPKNAKYVWLDIDPEKLKGFHQRASHLPAILGDATCMGIADKSMDYITCTAVTHHLTDIQLDRFVAEAARVVRKRMILLDALDTDAWQSKLMWHYDRGSYPRTREQLRNVISRYFSIQHIETYAIYHRYALIVADPH